MPEYPNYLTGNQPSTGSPSGYPALPGMDPSKPYVPPGTNLDKPPEDPNEPATPPPGPVGNPAEGVVFNAPVPSTLRNTRQFYPDWERTNPFGGSKYIPRGGLNSTGFIVRDVSMSDMLKTTAGNGWANASEYWGFRFHFNPSTFSESFSPPDGLDWAGFLQDIAYNPMLIQGHQGNSMISFQILLARFEDQRILRREGWRNYYTTTAMGQNDRQEILETGTQYDIERFFRVVNLDPVDTWRGKTSDWGMMMATPVMVFLGDSVGSRKFRAQIQTFNIQHQLYTPGMVPVYSQINITMSRIPDPYSGVIQEPEGDQATPTDPGSSTPGTPSTPTKPNQPSGPPSAIRDQNIRTALPIFTKWSRKNGNFWRESDWNALLNLWDKESRWNHKAENKGSSTYNGTTGTGAYGIPQAMPGTKMKSKGSDWLTNPVTQIEWGMEYIDGRYGSPDLAWRHSQKFNWY